MNSPEAKHPTLTVGEFYTRHSESLQLKLLGPSLGFDRRIREPTINRPGLALSGFFSYFADRRIQVLGSAELSYLKSLSENEAQARCQAVCAGISRVWSFHGAQNRRTRFSSRPRRRELPCFAPRW